MWSDGDVSEKLAKLKELYCEGLIEKCVYISRQAELVCLESPKRAAGIESPKRAAGIESPKQPADIPLSSGLIQRVAKLRDMVSNLHARQQNRGSAIGASIAGRVKSSEMFDESVKSDVESEFETESK